VTAFDALAADYGRLWSEAARGRSQRTRVWREIDRLFHAGDCVLDLGCGTGDDALHLAERGVAVIGIDASEKMVEIARGRGVDARRMRMEDFGRVGFSPRGALASHPDCEAEASRGLKPAFHGAISNFGALNCVEDLRPVAAGLGRLVRPGGAVAICLMGRFSPAETIRFLAKLEWRKAARRWSGRARWRGVEVFYHSSRLIRSAFAADFVFERRVSIGWGDHQLYVFRRMG
jgi:SAM-dependent methyltransferase